jgi:hypothetical protein
LRKALRGVDLVSKTGTMIEAPQLSDAQAQQLARDASWRVIRPPRTEMHPRPSP